MFAVYPAHFRAGWKADATVLPAGGGEIGAAYAAKVANDYERYHAGDVDGVIAHGNPTVQRMFAPKDRDGAPVAKSFRALQARADSVRMLVNIKILGGYQLGDYVVLEIQGTAENGWIERGPVILGRDSEGKFVRLFDRTISYPK